MKYINQLDYAHVPYRTNTKNDAILDKKKDVARSGCGLCALCMVIDLLTSEELSVEECVRMAEDCGASYGVGTDMSMLGAVAAEKFDIDYSQTFSLDEVIEHLRRGGQVIALMVVPEGEKTGLFTDGGHYINLISTDGEEFCILDPHYMDGRYDIPERAGKVDTTHAPYLYCDVNLVHAQTKTYRERYHLFSRKRGKRA